MRIVTWNVNSVRSRLERLLAFLKRHEPDIVCLQETKSLDHQFPSDALNAAGYRHLEPLGQKAYNGVALVSRHPLTNVARGFDADPASDEARVISASLPDGLRVVNAYVVNGQTVGSDKYILKLDWLDAFNDWIAATRDPADPLLVVGDFNIAPEDRDVYAPEVWSDRVLVSDLERERLRVLQAWGLTDLQREQTDEGGVYTWWDYRFAALQQNWGLRIDLMLGTAPVVQRMTGISVDRQEREKKTGPGVPSDHAPVILDLS